MIAPETAGGATGVRWPVDGGFDGGFDGPVEGLVDGGCDDGCGEDADEGGIPPLLGAKEATGPGWPLPLTLLEQPASSTSAVAAHTAGQPAFTSHPPPLRPRIFARL